MQDGLCSQFLRSFSKAAFLSLWKMKLFYCILVGEVFFEVCTASLRQISFVTNKNYSIFKVIISIKISCELANNVYYRWWYFVMLPFFARSLSLPMDWQLVDFHGSYWRSIFSIKIFLAFFMNFKLEISKAAWEGQHIAIKLHSKSTIHRDLTNSRLSRYSWSKCAAKSMVC